ncbi:RDD family protein, partial [Kribbella sp.]|uniref:RDD family protein n=1 Tax=Kribbella sp. TaxID=1871183 RepID=UPI002D40AC6C
MKQAGEERRQTAEAYQRAMTAVREQVKPLLGDHVAKRVKTFDDRTLFVESTVWGAIMAWLIDSVLVNGTALALAVLYGVRSTDPNKAGGAVVIFVLLLIVLPLLYGWFYANGRGIGALLTGTQLVRVKDGSRVGLAKA